jgi:DnaK suppressor protein
MPKTLNLQTINQTLKEQRVFLLAFLEKKRALINAEDLLNPDKADRAMISRNDNRETLLLEHAEQQLQDIDQALNRLERGTYGICSDCGENIQPARLEIIPTAVLCIKCQRILDNK